MPFYLRKGWFANAGRFLNKHQLIFWRHDSQHDDIHHKNICYAVRVLLCLVSFLHYAQCRKQAHYAGCRYAGCRHAECRGADFNACFEGLMYYGHGLIPVAVLA